MLMAFISFLAGVFLGPMEHFGKVRAQHLKNNNLRTTLNLRIFGQISKLKDTLGKLATKIIKKCVHVAPVDAIYCSAKCAATEPHFLTKYQRLN